MSPPPRPPIICYDLQTNSNARPINLCRQAPLSSARLKNKVTVVHKSLNDFGRARASASRNQDSLERNETRLDEVENVPSCTTTVGCRKSQGVIKLKQENTNQKPNVRLYTKNLVDHGRSQFHSNPFDNGVDRQSTTSTGQQDRHTTRLVYAQKLKQVAENRELRMEHRRRQMTMQSQLDEIAAQLEASKRIQQNLLKTFGVGHKAAEYIRKQDSEYEQLKKKLETFSENRSKELSLRVRQMRRQHTIQQQEDLKLERARLKDAPQTSFKTFDSSVIINNSLPSNLPKTRNTATNTSSSSPTISISSYSSSLSSSTEDSIVSTRPVKSHHQTNSQTSRFISSTSTPVNTSTRQCNSSTQNTVAKPLKDFSFYKPQPLDETLEVTDTEFFDKVEDKTMIEVDQLLKKMQCVLQDFERL